MRLALLGSGVFARFTYAPILSQLDCIELVAIWSRSQASAEALLAVVQKFASHVRCYYGDDGLSELLHSPDVDAVAVVLPVQATLQVVQQALSCGKHVLQEKPVAVGSAEAHDAVELFRKQQQQQQQQDAAGGPCRRLIWFYAENYRFEDAFLAAARWLSDTESGGVGPVIKIDLVVEMPIGESSRYYTSAWRRDSVGCPGGFCTDVLVHFIAAVRIVAAAAGVGEPTSASCSTSHVDPGLPAPDTLVGTLRCEARGGASSYDEAGCVGGTDGTASCGVAGGGSSEIGSSGGGCLVSTSVTFACSEMRCSLSVTGRQGRIEVLRGGWEGTRDAYVVSHQRAGEAAPTRTRYPLVGVERELRAFAQLVNDASAVGPTSNLSGRNFGDSNLTVGPPPAPPATATGQKLHQPEEGVRDLRVVEAMLRSAGLGGTPVLVQHGSAGDGCQLP